jgi:flagellar hook assembly protein FlgD
LSRIIFNYLIIFYGVTEVGNISYNIRGQLVRTLVNDVQNAGSHSIIWNGDDQQGRSVSSGIYFYRFETNTINQTRKMLLLK